MDLIELQKCKKDLLYLVHDIERWKNKPFLQTALISYLTGYPFNHNRDTVVKAYQELTGELS
jgi:hypothetical protein